MRVELNLVITINPMMIMIMMIMMIMIMMIMMIMIMMIMIMISCLPFGSLASVTFSLRFVHTLITRHCIFCQERIPK